MNAKTVPLPLRWLPRASLIKQSFEALCVNEFRGARVRGHMCRSLDLELDLKLYRIGAVQH